MIFEYDQTQNRKSKVFTDIQYALDLNLPVHVNDESVDQLYSLYAIGKLKKNTCGPNHVKVNCVKKL